jgi:hypothetical protein
MRVGRWSKVMDYGEGSASDAGWPEPLSWFADNRDFPGIVSALRAKGFSEEELGLIMGGNWVDLLERAAQPSFASLEERRRAMTQLTPTVEDATLSLRSPATVMDLERLGSFSPTRLSFRTTAHAHDVRATMAGVSLTV